jgi:tetratricopeptide (TPR) repeat protein
VLELTFFVATIVFLIILLRRMPSQIPQTEKEEEEKEPGTKATFEEKLDMADLMAQEGDFRGAEKIYLKLVTEHPEDATLYNRLGMVYLHEKNYTDAKEALEQALALSPENDTIYNNLGLLAFQQKQYTKALEYYDQSIKINNRIASRFVNLGLTYYMKKQYRKARDSYEQALILDPKEESYQDLLKQVEEKLENS